MIRSMTAFAGRRGALGPQSWQWELRSVNGRGLDLRLRLPEGIEGLETAARAALAARLHRGNVTLSLRLAREEGAARLGVDPAQLEAALTALAEVEYRAAGLGLTLAQTSAAEILSLRGVLLQAAPAQEDAAALLAALTTDLDALIADFAAMRAGEGAAIAAVLNGQFDAIARLVDEAATAAAARQEDARLALSAAVRRLLDESVDLDPARLAQELALLAVKNDVTEELDRLRAHIGAARALLADPAPAGRKLDFLAQEFNREANTLCSKAQSQALTRIGLDLKALIDQMREQVQNIE